MARSSLVFLLLLFIGSTWSDSSEERETEEPPTSTPEPSTSTLEPSTSTPLPSTSAPLPTTTANGSTCTKVILADTIQSFLICTPTNIGDPPIVSTAFLNNIIEGNCTEGNGQSGWTINQGRLCVIRCRANFTICEEGATPAPPSPIAAPIPPPPIAAPIPPPPTAAPTPGPTCTTVSFSYARFFPQCFPAKGGDPPIITTAFVNSIVQGTCEKDNLQNGWAIQNGRLCVKRCGAEFTVCEA